MPKAVWPVSWMIVIRFVAVPSRAIAIEIALPSSVTASCPRVAPQPAGSASTSASSRSTTSSALVIVPSPLVSNAA